MANEHQAEEATAAPAQAGLMITKERVKGWRACTDGYRWFLKNFPQGGAEYAQVYAALQADRRSADAGWLASKAFDHAMGEEPAAIRAIVDGRTTDAKQLINQTTALMVVEVSVSLESEGASSSGNATQIGSSGDDAQIGSSGDDAQIGSSGDSARIGSSGDGAQIGSSG